MQAFYLDRVDSTNDAATRLLREGRISSIAYVVAREQTAGKGTRGRTWSSPRDAGVYLSVVDRPVSRDGDVQRYTRAAGVACVEAIREETEVEVGLKPVNDLYVLGRKLGGILTEAKMEGGSMIALITGVGVNVRRAVRPTMDGAVDPICLEDVMLPERFSRLDISSLILSLVRQIRQWNGAAAEGGHRMIADAWDRYRIDFGRAGDGLNRSPSH